MTLAKARAVPPTLCSPELIPTPVNRPSIANRPGQAQARSRAARILQRSTALQTESDCCARAPGKEKAGITFRFRIHAV